MMLTKAGEYAVRCMLYLATMAADEVVSRKEISAARDIPGPFLSKIAQNLATAGLIQIVKGPLGGYRLLKSPENISLLEVIEAVEGEIYLNECLLYSQSCKRSACCSVHQVWKSARAGLRETLGRADLAGLTHAEQNAAICGDVEGKQAEIDRIPKPRKLRPTEKEVK